MTNSPYSWMDRVLHYGGIVIFLLGAVIAVAGLWPGAWGWFTGMRVTLGAGLALAACGAGLAGLGYSRLLPAKIAGGFTVTLALVTLYEYLNTGKVFPDQILLIPDINESFYLSDRIAPTVVLAYLFSGLSLLLLAGNTWLRQHKPLVLSFLAVSALLFPLISGFLTGLGTGPAMLRSAFFSWPVFGAKVLLNAGILLAVWRLQVREERRPFIWSAVFVGVGFVVLFIILWKALLQREGSQIDDQLQLQTDGIRLQLQKEISLRMDSLELLAVQWVGPRVPPPDRWEAESRLFRRVYPAVPGVIWVDPDLRHSREFPSGPVAAWPDAKGAKALRQEALKRAASSGGPSFSRFLAGKEGPQFYMLAPVVRNRVLAGIIAAPFQLAIMVHRIFPQVGQTSFALSLRNSGAPGLEYASEPEPRALPWSRTLEFSFFGAPWELRVWPTASAVRNGQTLFPEATLFLGTLLAFLLALVVHMAQWDQMSLRDLANINREMQLNAGRRERAETSLRQSDTRLRSIVDNLASGLVTLDKDGSIESVNPAACRLFGYQGRDLAGWPFDLLVPGWKNRTGSAELVGRRKNGGSFPAELLLFEFTGAHGAGQAALVQDLSPRREADRLKKQFVSMVSHELRTPLASIRGSLGLLSSGALGALPKDIAQMVVIAERNCLRLESLINDLLDLERVSQGKMQLTLRACPLSRTIHRALDSVRGQAQLAGIHLVSEIQESTVMVDEDRLVQVLVNLLSNAVKFSPAGEKVEVVAAVKGPLSEVKVTDHGPGVPPELQEAIFEPFFQVDAADSRRRGGSGLGLSISRAMVREFGGSIGVQSVPGAGSAFWFSIPRTEAAAASQGGGV